MLAPAQTALFTTSTPSLRPIIARPQILQTSSKLLFKTLTKIYSNLNFNTLDNKIFQNLIITQMVEPTNLSNINQILTKLKHYSMSLSTHKQTLHHCINNQYQKQLTKLCFTHTTNHNNISLILYDMTTLYFEANNKNNLRKVNYSKKHHIDPQIIIKLLVDQTKFPLKINCFKNNKTKKHTLLPIIDAFKTRHDIEHIIMVTNTKMLSTTNLTTLNTTGYKFVISSQITKTPIDLKSHFR